MNNKINVSLQDVSGKQWNFVGLRELYEFCEAEAKYWGEKLGAAKPPHPYLNVNGVFQAILTTLDNWKNQIGSWDENHLQQNLISLQRNHLNNLPRQWLWSGHPYSSHFVECNQKYGVNVASFFLDFILKKQPSNVHTFEGFMGYMLAYEFINQDSDIVKRRNGEKISLGHLRNQLETTTQTLIGEVEDFKSDFNNWNKETKENWAKWITESSGEHRDQQNNNNKQAFDDYMNVCKGRIESLENTYQDLLRLKKPAEYWHKAAEKYEIQGYIWIGVLGACALLGIAGFYDFYTAWLQGQSTHVQLQTLQGIIIFISIVTIFAFLIRTFSRLTFSSFHLMRDAEEREQLTYLYLSLSEDNKIDESSRTVILQALFSRSETGLLASESGPTMPGIADLIKSVKS